MTTKRLPARSKFIEWLRTLARNRLPRDPRLLRTFWAAAVFVVGLALLVSSLTPGRYDLEVGGIVPEDIFAPRTVVDRLATERARQAAAAQVPDQYEVDLAKTFEAEAVTAAVFAAVREANASSAPGAERAAGLVNAVAVYGVTLNDDAVKAALAAPPDVVDALERHARTIVESIMQGGVKQEYLEAARAQAATRVADLGLDRGQRALLRAVTDVAIVPNLRLNAAATQAKREEAMASVAPVQVLKGQVIARAGEVATPEQIALLRDLGLLRRAPPWGAVLGLALALGLMLAAVRLHLRLFDRSLLDDPRRLSLLGLIVVVTMLLSAAGRMLSGYFVPVALGTMLTAVLLDVRHGAFLALVLGVYVGLLTGGDLGFAAVAATGGVAGAFVSSRLGQRTELMRAGLLVAGADVVGVAAMDAFAGQGLFELATLRDMVWGAGAGLVSGVLTIGLLPFLEDVFGILTNLKLLELANPNQPLLRRLLLEAPGTYHHSIVVGNLAEAAVAEVGGNAALVRVGAYYHDIGKVRRPEFFVENQFGGDNPHDKLAPSLSALVITAHVRDGVAMAERAALPEPVIDLIRQHHGDCVVSFFYNRATENGEADSVHEADFRYEGPRPQTREAAVLMLADACEAAVRALGKASPGRIEGVVRRVIKERLDAGQLQDSPLTLQDLSRIGTVFSRLLAGTFHRRVEYPDLVREARGRRAAGAEGRPGQGNGSKKDGADHGSKKEGAKRVG